MDQVKIKIQKTGKIISILLKVMRIATYVGIGLLVASLVWLIAFSDGATSVIFDKITINAPFSVNTGFDRINTIIYFSTILVSGIILAFILYFAQAIFRDIAVSYTPFVEINTKRMRAIAISFVVMAIIPSMVAAILVQSLKPTADISTEIQADYIIVAVIMYCLSYIFEYGRLLQQQSDETI